MLNAIANLDTITYLWCIRLQQKPGIPYLLRFISRTGDGYLYVAMGIYALIVGGSNQMLFLYAGVWAFLIELPGFMLLKSTIRRDRPYKQVSGSTPVIRPGDKFSMPSGHTTAAFLMAGLVSYFFREYAFIVYFWASLIGMSRVAMGVHYPSDILAGAALGTSCAVLGVALVI